MKVHYTSRTANIWGLTEVPNCLPSCLSAIKTSIPFLLHFHIYTLDEVKRELGNLLCLNVSNGPQHRSMCSWDPYEKYVCVYNGMAHLQPVTGGRASGTHLLSLAAAPNEMFAADTLPFPPKQGRIVDLWYEKANCVGFYLVLCKLKSQMHLVFTHLFIYLFEKKKNRNTHACIITNFYLQCFGQLTFLRFTHKSINQAEKSLQTDSLCVS